MKKIIIAIISIFLTVIVIVYMNCKQAIISYNDSQKFNSDYEFYNNRDILGTDITTLINKAIDNNEKYSIEKDKNNVYIPDDKYSVKIYIHMIINDKTYPMESLVETSLTEFTKYFGEVNFKCSDIKYHEKTGRISEMVFESLDY